MRKTLSQGIVRLDAMLMTDIRRPLDPALRAELVADLPPLLRQVRREVLVETLAAGSPVDPDVVTVVLSAHVDRSYEPLRISSTDVESLLWFGIAEFCSDHDLEMPGSSAGVLHAILSCMVRLEVLAPGSDEVGRLFAPLRELGAA